MATVFKRGGNGRRGGRYYIAYFDHQGKRQVQSARTTDKATAERIAAKLEADAALRRDGVVDAQMESVAKQSKRTVEAHLRDFEAKMIAANRDAKHIATTVSYIRTICEVAGFAVVADIEADGVNLYASRLKQLGRSARTVQAHLVAIKGFTRWLTEHRKLTHDPLALVQRPNAKADQRRERRMLLHDEWDWLRMTTLAGVERYGMPPVERVLLYVVAIQTGLRSSELRSLTRGRLFLDSKPPYITCKAGWTKNHKDARQYIQPALADELRLHIATKVPKSWVFSMPAREDVAAMLRADLADARQAWLKAAKHDGGNKVTSWQPRITKARFWTSIAFVTPVGPGWR